MEEIKPNENTFQTEVLNEQKNIGTDLVEKTPSIPSSNISTNNLEVINAHSNNKPPTEKLTVNSIVDSGELTQNNNIKKEENLKENISENIKENISENIKENIKENISENKEEKEKKKENKEEKEKKKENKQEENEKNQDEYEVESILDEKMNEREKEYLIKWKGYSIEDSTFETIENIVSSELIEDFIKNRSLYKLSYSKGNPVFNPEEILDKRYQKNKIFYKVKFKGIPNGLWEPGDSLSKQLIRSFETKRKRSEKSLSSYDISSTASSPKKQKKVKEFINIKKASNIKNEEFLPIDKKIDLKASFLDGTENWVNLFELRQDPENLQLILDFFLAKAKWKNN